MGGTSRFLPKICPASGEPNLRWSSRSNVPWRIREPHPRAADEDGAVLAQARHDKETTHPELIN